ncbi:MAG: hypothetical protein Q9166_001693 [cf. Caloplaca sp. 2 TL-2023]
MTATITCLPYELLSSILEEAAVSNAQDIQRYTYGVDSTSTTGKALRILRGHVANDHLRWLSTDAIRQVNTQWHDWACHYALRDLYIRRWRGSERWTESRKLHIIHRCPSRDVFYRDPYCSLRKTVDLFTKHPSLASSVRRIFFDGFYGIETNMMIFEVLKHCDQLDLVSLPWTALRYGSDEDWSSLLRRRHNGTALSSLELLAVDLKQSQIKDHARQVNKHPLECTGLDFGHLRRLKLSGSSNLMPIIDDDLMAISRTARLQELHITGTTSITTKGLAALGRASEDTLRVLEHSPLSNDGFEHPNASSTDDGSHLCKEIVQCPHLRDLAVSLPTICSDLFSEPSVNWVGDVQIRAAGVCAHFGSLEASDDTRKAFFNILSRARVLIEAQRRKHIKLNIELFVGHFIFEPSKSLVHADLSVGEILSAGSWPVMPVSSYKGPYGQTGQYGKDERAYHCISEEEFAEGLRKGYVSF